MNRAQRRAAARHRPVEVDPDEPFTVQITPVGWLNIYNGPDVPPDLREKAQRMLARLPDWWAGDIPDWWDPSDWSVA